MKKTLLALAVLASFAGAASAQTSVTVYGVADAGIVREIGAPAGSVWKLGTGIQSGNRLGFKGTEDLGSGLKANFQLEAGFNLDTGTGRQGALFGRQAFVGLSGGFGAVNFGRQYTPFFIAMDLLDPFDYGLLGANTNIINSGTLRVNNSIQYSSVNMGGFSASVLYGLGEQAGAISQGSTTDLALTYANGPLAVYAAYDYQKLPATLAAITPATPITVQKLALVGATYDFGPAKAHLAYETEKNDLTMDFRDILVGVTVPFGASTILASFTDKKDKSAAGNAGAKQYAIAYTYALSKRTNLYTSYGHIRNKGANSNAYIGDASNGGLDSLGNPTGNTGAFAVGVRHKF